MKDLFKAEQIHDKFIDQITSLERLTNSLDSDLNQEQRHDLNIHLKNLKKEISKLKITITKHHVKK